MTVGMHTTKEGKTERFIVEVLAIPGVGGNPTFTVHMIHPEGEIFAHSGPHDKASALFERVLKKATSEISGLHHDWLGEALTEGDRVYRP